jgi:hypothetical protein
VESNIGTRYTPKTGNLAVPLALLRQIGLRDGETVDFALGGRENLYYQVTTQGARSIEVSSSPVHIENSENPIRARLTIGENAPIEIGFGFLEGLE